MTWIQCLQENKAKWAVSVLSVSRKLNWGCFKVRTSGSVDTCFWAVMFSSGLYFFIFSEKIFFFFLTNSILLSAQIKDLSPPRSGSRFI